MTEHWKELGMAFVAIIGSSIALILKRKPKEVTSVSLMDKAIESSGNVIDMINAQIKLLQKDNKELKIRVGELERKAEEDKDIRHKLREEKCVLEGKNKRLEKENKKLTEENESLRKQIDAPKRNVI